MPEWRNGRRKRLKIVRRNPWGFESPLGHQRRNEPGGDVGFFFRLGPSYSQPISQISWLDYLSLFDKVVFDWEYRHGKPQILPFDGSALAYRLSTTFNLQWKQGEECIANDAGVDADYQLPFENWYQLDAFLNTLSN